MGPIRATYEFLRGRARAYMLCFRTPAGMEVLADLAKFCRANEPCWSADPREHALQEGRREVWLRIEKHVRLTPDQLYAIYTGRTFDPLLMDKEDKDHT